MVDLIGIAERVRQLVERVGGRVEALKRDWEAAAAQEQAASIELAREREFLRALEQWLQQHQLVSEPYPQPLKGRPQRPLPDALGLRPV